MTRMACLGSMHNFNSAEELAAFIAQQYSKKTFLNLDEFFSDYHRDHDRGTTNPYIQAELRDHVCQALEHLLRTGGLALDFTQYSVVTRRAEIGLTFH